MNAKDAARELLELTGHEVTFAGKPMLAVLLEVLFEDAPFTVETDGKSITIRKVPPYRVQVESEVPSEH